jgi:hypothetical protein
LQVLSYTDPGKTFKPDTIGTDLETKSKGYKLAMNVKSFESGSIKWWLDSGVTRLHLVGRLSGADIGAAHAQGVLCSPSMGSVLVYQDWTKAQLDSGARSVLHGLALQGRSLQGPVCRHGVMVVKPEDRDFFRSCAWASAQLGVVRGVFTESCRAQAWLQERAALLGRIAQHSPQIPPSVPARRTRGAAALDQR